MAQDNETSRNPEAMDQTPPTRGKSSQENSGYGSGYGGGYGGYGYGGGYGGGYGYGGDGYGGGGAAGGGQPGRSFKDYLMLLRERIWYFVVVFFIIFTGTVLYTIQSTPLYRAAATVRLLREPPGIMKAYEGTDTNEVIRSAEDFNTEVGILNSVRIANSVADRIRDEDRRLLMAPYENRLGGALNILEVLMRNRRVVPAGTSMMVNVLFTHPDPDIAALVANAFADEFINYSMRESIGATMGMTEDLRVRAENQRSLVERQRTELGEYMKKHNNVSFDPEKNILVQQLGQISSQLSEDKRNLDMADTQWRVIESARQRNESLLNIPAIAQQQRISELLSRRAQQEIDLASLSRRYRDKHPTMIENMRAYEQTQEEIQKAVDQAVENARVSFAQAQQNYDQTQRRLAAKEAEIMVFNEQVIRYRTMEDELNANIALYNAMLQRLNITETGVNLVTPRARVVDRAFRPFEPYSPNIPLNLVVGVVLGAVGGLAVVFGMAMLDDRIKTVQDVEEVVGLPLIGVVPRIKRLNSMEKAQAVASNAEQRITESFRAIHSAMRLNELSKKAKIILTTSTSPSEGKSFVTTNLAITFAIHGERTLVIDADLRMPSVGKSLSLEGDNGLVKYLSGGCTFEEALIKDFYPNLDVLPAGQKAKNPTQILNSNEFLGLLEQLSEQYDRIFIDTPPLAVVSDVLSLLPHADGLIYVIKYNTIKRKSARANLRRLTDSQTPVFGAVLNQISIAAANYYTAYYDKSYAKYYDSDGGTSVKLKGQAYMPDAEELERTQGKGDDRA